MRLHSKDVVLSARDWQGREVVLDRQTLQAHILRYHYDVAFILEALKAQFSKPRIVIESKQNKSENAIYDLPCGGMPCTMVAVKQGWLLKKRQIATIYPVENGYQPKGRVLWPTKKNAKK